MAAKKPTARFVEVVATSQERDDFRHATVRGPQLPVTKAGAKT